MKPSSRRRIEEYTLTALEKSVRAAPRSNPLGFAWRWRYELVLGIGGIAGVVLLIRAVGAAMAVFASILPIAVVSLLPAARQFAVARAWCIITPHRVRAACVEARMHVRKGRLPFVVLTSQTRYGERVLLWCRAGNAAEDFDSALPLLRTACWATDVQITHHPRYAHLVTLHVTRRPAPREATYLSPPQHRAPAGPAGEVA